MSDTYVAPVAVSVVCVAPQRVVPALEVIFVGAVALANTLMVIVAQEELVLQPLANTSNLELPVERNVIVFEFPSQFPANG